MPRIDIWADTKGKSICNSCQAPIEWATVRKSGKKMPFDGEIVSVQTGNDPDTWRAFETVDTDVTRVHFETCPDAARWRRKT